MRSDGGELRRALVRPYLEQGYNRTDAHALALQDYEERTAVLGVVEYRRAALARLGAHRKPVARKARVDSMDLTSPLVPTSRRPRRGGR
jgi:hypothetical protein